jgi:hypothetical protein
MRMSMTSVRKEHNTIGIMILIRKKCKYGYHGEFGIIKKNRIFVCYHKHDIRRRLKHNICYHKHDLKKGKTYHDHDIRIINMI